eukprot:6369254-Pyramimonas_sp.AAC.1
MQATARGLAGPESLSGLALLCCLLHLRVQAFQHILLDPLNRAAHARSRAEVDEKLNEVAQSVGDLWSVRQFGDAFAALRRPGAAGKKHRQAK